MSAQHAPATAAAAVAALQAAPQAAALRRARSATRVQFAVLGTLAGAWGAHIPSLVARYRLDEAVLALVLLAAAAGAISAVLLAGRLVAHLGARRATQLSGTGMCTMLALVLWLPGLPALWPVALVLGACMSLFDVAINSEGATLEQLSRRPIMSNLHAMFSVGGMAGAALVSVLLQAGLAPAWQLLLLCSALGALVLLGSRGMLGRPSPGAGGDMSHFAWPRGVLLVIGLLILAGMLAEGVMYDWCVLYLKQELGLPQARAALGYAAFSGAMALARFGGDALRARLSERRLLQGGALLAALAMALVLLAAQPVVAILGFALVGAGLAPVAPILYNAATRVPGVSPAAGIASVTAIGYSGFMVGPPLIGGLARASSLSLALGVVVLAAAVLALCARWVPQRA